MPHYFFHLAFGTRTVLDEEGVELPDRSAARAEALAAIRELSDAPTGGNSRRWAGWFLQLADEQGKFFRTPIGHPALELATPPRPAEERSLNPASATSPARQGATSAPTEVAELVRQLSRRQQHAAQLLEHSRRLQHELSSLCAANERIRARELVAYARLVTARSNDAGVSRTDARRAAHHGDHLLLSAGLIRYRRGHIQVLDRAALEDISCECYAVTRQNVDKVFAARPPLR